MEVNDQVIDAPDDEKEVPIEETIRDAIRASNPEPAPEPAKPAAVRDEAGKFAERPKRETLTLKPADAGINPNHPALGAEAPAAAPQTFKAPDALKPELKAKFNELPPEWQAEWTRREADAHKALTKQDEERTLGRRVNEMALPYLPTIRAEGATVEKAFQEYLQTAHVLRSGTPAQKSMALRQVAQQFNVDLSLPLQQGPRDPQIAQLERQLAEVQGQLQGFTRQHQNQELHSLQSQIDDFASKPGHEHFDRVRTHMGILIENGMSPDLEDAYQRAVYADPEIRSSLIASQSQAETDKRLAEAKAKADAARRAGGSVSGGPGASRPLNGSGAEVPLEETIRAAIRESSGRV